MKHSINLIYAYDLINKSNGQSFTATFIKSDGTQRIMNCRLKVKKGTNGKGLKYYPIEKGLLPVFDLQLARQGIIPKECHRMINLLTLQNLNINNNNFIVV